MNITVIGAGRLGSAVSAVWKDAGHAVVTTASRRADELQAACDGADLVVLAVPFDAIDGLARNVSLSGKVVIDATNGGGDYEKSGSERVAAAFGQAKVCKALNTVFSTEYAKVAQHKGSASMFLSGDDAGAKATVSRAIADMGFEPVDAGPLSSARFIEALGMLVVSVAYRMGRGPFTYKIG